MLALVFASLLTLAPVVTEPGLPTQNADPTPITASTAGIADRAKALIAQIQDGKVDRTLLTPEFSSAFTSAAIAADATFLAGRGKPTRFGLLQRSDVGSDTRYVFYAGWDAGAVAYTFGVDKATDLIDACYFRATAAAPL